MTQCVCFRGDLGAVSSPPLGVKQGSPSPNPGDLQTRGSERVCVHIYMYVCVCVRERDTCIMCVFEWDATVCRLNWLVVFFGRFQSLAVNMQGIFCLSVSIGK